MDMFSKAYAKITSEQEAGSYGKDGTITVSDLAFHRAKLFGCSLKQDIDVQLRQNMFPNTQPGDPDLSNLSHVVVDVRILDLP